MINKYNRSNFLQTQNVKGVLEKDLVSIAPGKLLTAEIEKELIYFNFYFFFFSGI